MEQRQNVETRSVSANLNRPMWFTLPLDVIWKHHMGERHCTFLRLIAHTLVIKWAVFLLMLLAFPNDLVPEPGPLRYSGWFALYGFILVMWIFGLANLWEIRRRRKAGIRWHTHYWGRPRFLPDWPIVHCLVIPIGSGLIAYRLFRLFPPLGIYLFIMAGMQFLEATDAYRARRIEKLNRSDREIHMRIKTAELEESYRGPLDIVRIAPPSKRTRTPEQDALFHARWQRVLKPADSQRG